MRISVQPNDPGFAELQRLGIDGVFVRVFLDGARIDHTVTADDEVGLIVAYVIKDGKLVADPVTEEIKTEILYGKVEIVLPGQLMLATGSSSPSADVDIMKHLRF